MAIGNLLENGLASSLKPWMSLSSFWPWTKYQDSQGLGILSGVIPQSPVSRGQNSKQSPALKDSRMRVALDFPPWFYAEIRGKGQISHLPVWPTLNSKPRDLKQTLTQSSMSKAEPLLFLWFMVSSCRTTIRGLTRARSLS